MTKEQIISATKEYATRLGRCPTHTELKQQFDVETPQVRKFFGSYLKLIRTCGLKPLQRGRLLPMEELFVDWAEVTRKLGRIPTGNEYDKHSQFCRSPLIARFGGWSRVPAGLLMFAERSSVAHDWKDVVEIASAHVERQNFLSQEPIKPSAWNCLPGIREDRARYGEPMVALPMLSVPTSESAVLILFGAVAWDLGFSVLRSQAKFPDCEALRRVTPDAWQLTRIEFELQSRNFVEHQHDPTKCDLIICWEHNWPECPLEVLELKTVLREKGFALWQNRGRLPMAQGEVRTTAIHSGEQPASERAGEAGASE